VSMVSRYNSAVGTVVPVGTVLGARNVGRSVPAVGTVVSAVRTGGAVGTADTVGTDG
jgi:hypothetical protein